MFRKVIIGSAFLGLLVTQVPAHAGVFKGEKPASYELAYSGPTTFVYNPKNLRWYAYDGNGRLVKSGKGSGGKGYCPDIGRGCKTPVGSFRVYSKQGANFRSSKYPVGEGGAPMPYAMFFRGGYAIHGSNSVPNFNASHGCIRVVPSDARWLSTEFLKHGSRVVVLPYGGRS